MIAEPSLSVIVNAYVWFALFTGAVFELMLYIHCCPVGSQRKAVSGVVESGASFTLVVIVPEMICVKKNPDTTPGVPMGRGRFGVTGRVRILPVLLHSASRCSFRPR